MDSLAGQTISHYHVLARVSEREAVYKAEDTHSGSLVQLKFLPKEALEDQKAFAQFQHVVRTIAALNHPRIAAVYGLGECEGRPFLVTEFADGETLAQHIAQKPARFSDVLSVSEQVADALDAAHSAGVIHGGLQPTSILLTRAGQVKVADFGLATLRAAALGDRSAPAPVSWQAPEQRRGEEADGRTDLFSLGSILYEMATGQTPFSGPDEEAVRQAILEGEPPRPSEVNPDLPASFDPIVVKAIDKDREMRYQFAAELRTDLRRLHRDWESERVAAARAALAETVVPAAPKEGGGPALGPPAAAASGSKLSTALSIAAALLLAAAVGAAAARLLYRSPRPLPLVLHPLTFGRGLVNSARFAPGSRTIFYTAEWDGDPPRVFSVSPGSRPVPLGVHDAEVLAVSPSKELAILTDVHLSVYGRAEGNLQNVALEGGAAQPLLSGVEAADWSPAGRSIAVVRRVDGMDRLEYPIGTVLAATPGWIGDPRFSPEGDRIAFLDHPRANDDAGSLAVVDLGGKERTLVADWANVSGLAWSAQGKEIWFTGSRGGGRKLYAVDLAGKTRQVMTTPGSLHLYDVAPDGRVLLARDDGRMETGEITKGREGESRFNGSELRDVSADGKTLLFEEPGGAEGFEESIFVRGIEASTAQRLGAGRALALSPNGKEVLAETAGGGGQLATLRVGGGAPVNLPAADMSHLWATWLPDGKRFVFLGHEPGRRLRLFVEDAAGGRPRSISPAGVGSSAAVSPDGRRVAVMGPDGAGYLYPVDGGSVSAFRGLAPGDRLVGWSRYGAALYVAQGTLPANIFRLSLASGARTPVWKIAPADRAGVTRLRMIRVTPDGRFCFFSYRRTLAQLYLADGLH